MIEYTMHGYMGKSARIDLSTARIDVFPTPENLRFQYLGGRGMGVALIQERITLACDDPAMPLIFSTGPLVGTESPASGRMSVVSRSPLTGTVFDSSVGGRFGTALKGAGFDFIEVCGIAPEWSLLSIAEQGIKIERAPLLIGKNARETRGLLGQRGSEAVIGVSGERGVRYASIVVDGRYLAGRGGLGAVMGYKRLKAVVVEGSRKVPVADESALRDARVEIMRLLRSCPAIFGEFGIAQFGTAALVDLIHARRLEPTENFRKTYFESSPRYSGYRLRERYQPRMTGCAGCPVSCKMTGARGEQIPEYGTASHFGALNGCGDLDAIVAMNELCNDFGLDSISAAAAIACYQEVSGRRLAPSEILGLLRDVAAAEGELGKALAEGSLRYARAAGRPEASMSVKGLELPAYDPRGAYGLALAYTTSNRGGCHLRAYPVSHEILRKPVATDRFTFEGKARIVKVAEDMNAVVDSLTACRFAFLGAGLEEYAKAVTAVTGRTMDVQDLLAIGERIWNLERHLNRLNGFTDKDDDLPHRFFSEEGTSGPNVAMPPLDREAFLQARQNYYKVRGYASRSGRGDAETDR